MVVKEAIFVGGASTLITGLISGATNKEWRKLIAQGVVTTGLVALALSYIGGGFAVPGPTPRRAAVATAREIFPSSPVSVNKFYSEPISEFYLNGPGEHVYVD